MPLENIPWAVLDGITSATLARMLAFTASGGEEGVAGIGDFVVRQTTVASGSVRVGLGGGILINRYPGARNESYMVRAGDETPVAIAANSTGSVRYDLVICRIDDWNYPGQQSTPGALPTNVVAVSKFAVLSGVASNVKTASQLNLGYPAIALARIAVPAATSAITQAMITDLREKAVPRRKRDVRAVGQLSGRNNTLAQTATTGEIFPQDGIFTVEIPYWATRMVVQSHLGGISLAPGTAYGSIWVRIGNGRSDAFNTQTSNIDATAARSDPSRETALVADSVAIPAAMRGQSIQIVMAGRKLGGTVNLLADGATSMALDMEFLESATEDL